MAIFGVVFNYAVYYPLRNRSFLPVIISTLGASIFMQNTVLGVFGPQPPDIRMGADGGARISVGELQRLVHERLP